MYFCVNTEKSLVISKNWLATVFYSAVVLGNGQLHDFVFVSFAVFFFFSFLPNRKKKKGHPRLVPFLLQGNLEFHRRCMLAPLTLCAACACFSHLLLFFKFMLNYCGRE